MRYLAASLVLLSVACGNAPTTPHLSEPPIPAYVTVRDGYVLFAPPPAEYRDWWQRLEQCSGVDGDFDRVKFYYHPTEEVLIAPTGVGVTDWGNHRMYFGKEAWDEQVIVAPSMMHELLQSGDYSAYFEQCREVLTGREVVTSWTLP